MNKRLLLIGCACLLAVAVLLLALLVDEPAPQLAPRQSVAPPALGDVGVDPNALQQPATDLTNVELARGIDIYSEEGKTVTRFTGSEVRPKPNFNSEVTLPTAEVRFSPQRVMLITAASGTFYHPGNVPQRGVFDANTVVTFFEAPEGEALDLTTERHIQFRLFLDETTHFNRELGRINSDGPVHLIGPDVDFTGRGLSLTYNRLAERIEQLVVTEGDYLRIASDAQFSSDDKPAAADAAGPAANAGSDAGEDADAGEPAAPAATTYQATLHRNVRIEAGQHDATLRGDRLVALFALTPTVEDEASADLPSATPRLTPPVMLVKADTDATPSAANPTRTLHTASPDDIVVRWDGQLIMLPIDAGDHDLASPDDALITLYGSPATIETTKNERIAGASVGYRAALDRVFAQGSDEFPLAIYAPELGQLTGEQLWMDQANATGQVVGPGKLATDDGQLDVTYQQQLDLAFVPDAQGQLTAIQSATFVGDVQAHAQGKKPEDKLDITSQSLALSFTHDPQGNPEPTHLRAIGNDDLPVRATQPTTALRARQLDVDLARAETPAGAGDDQPEFTITRLRALGEINLRLEDDDTTLTAHALDADPITKRLELFGQDNNHATITRAQDVLTGLHLIFHEEQESADALGPGTFSARVDENDPEARLNVTWSQSMAFNNLLGQARFIGNVNAASTSSTDDTVLENAYSLDLTFDPQQLNAPATPAPNPTPETPSEKSLDLRTVRAVADPNDTDALLTFTARTFEEAGNDQPLTRTTLESRELHFDNLPPNLDDDTTINDRFSVQQVVIPRRGRMLLEDYRTPAKDADQPDVAEDGPISFAGRGITAFQWEGSLTLDALRNDARMVGHVLMIHQPAEQRSDNPADDRVQLDAEQLTVDLTETGGLGAFLTGDAPKAQIRKINADGTVQVSQAGASVIADHLEYLEETNTVELWAEPGYACVLTQADQPNPQHAARLEWNLTKDEVRALEPGAGLIPVRE